MTRLKTLLASAAIAGFAISGAHAQDSYPTDDITIIVPYAAGGATDILARKLADELSGALDQTVIVENRPGAGATLGTTLAARAEPDGYTLFLGQVSSHGIAPNLYPDLKYDAVKDFAPIVFLESIPNVMVVNKDFPADTVDEFIAYAKENPGEVNFASSGIGSSIHLSGEMFKAAAGIDMMHIPYNGSAPAVTALIGGQVNVMFDNLPSSMQHIESGTLKALAVTTPERAPALPDVPTVAEAATAVDLSGFEAAAWFGLLGPAGMPEPVIQRLNKAVNAILETEEMQKFLGETGANPEGGTPEDLARHIESELAKWKKVIDEAGVTLE